MKYNVVFITTDQQRRDACGCYGNDRIKTPNIDRLASEGIRFTNAYCDSPLCAPSRASYISGRQVYKHGAFSHKVNGKSSGYPNNGSIQYTETLGTMHRKAGYKTAAIGKLHVHGETRLIDLGFDVRKHRFYTYNYEDYNNSIGESNVKKYLNDKGRDCRLKYNESLSKVELTAAQMQDTLTTDSSIEFIKQNKDKPFFIHVGLEKPHPAWTTQEKFLSLYDPEDMIVPDNRYDWWENGHKFPFFSDKGYDPRQKEQFTDESIQRCIAAYYACVSEADNNVGRLLDTLDDENIRDNTIVIFSTDHGDNLFEHGLTQKHCFYEGAVGIPLIVSLPNKLSQNTVCDQLVTLIDIMPTLAEINDIAIPEDIDGSSLLPYINGLNDDERMIFSEIHVPNEDNNMSGRMVRYKQWKYIYYIDDTELMFNLKDDPTEMKNVAANSEYKEIKALLKTHTLDNWQDIVKKKYGEGGIS